MRILTITAGSSMAAMILNSPPHCDKGMQVAPAELEALLLTHPAVADAAVVRKQDAEAGEVPKAFVVLKPDEASRATGAKPSWPRWQGAFRRTSGCALELIDAIPKSASGTILRRLVFDCA